MRPAHRQSGQRMLGGPGHPQLAQLDNKRVSRPRSHVRSALRRPLAVPAAGDAAERCQASATCCRRNDLPEGAYGLNAEHSVRLMTSYPACRGTSSPAPPTASQRPRRLRLERLRRLTDGARGARPHALDVPEQYRVEENGDYRAASTSSICRASKLFRIKNFRIEGVIDVFNVFNADNVLAAGTITFQSADEHPDAARDEGQVRVLAPPPRARSVHDAIRVRPAHVELTLAIDTGTVVHVSVLSIANVIDPRSSAPSPNRTRAENTNREYRHEAARRAAPPGRRASCPPTRARPTTARLRARRGQRDAPRECVDCMTIPAGTVFGRHIHDGSERGGAYVILKGHGTALLDDRRAQGCACGTCTWLRNEHAPRTSSCCTSAHSGRNAPARAGMGLVACLC